MKKLILITVILTLNACAAIAPVTVLGIGVATGIVVEEQNPNAVDITKK